MAPRGCSHTAHTPVCVLFQPMKVPEVPLSKTRSFDLLRASSGRLLEENKDHQLFNAFLEPYWNSDRLFSLKAVLLCDSLPPVPPKKRPQTPLALNLIFESPAFQEREESIKYLSGSASAPLPTVLNPVFTVDDSLSEFMRIRGKAPGHPGTSSAPVTTSLHRNRKIVMTTMKKKGTAGEKKGFFDISCVVCLSEDFPLFPVVSHFL